MEINYSKNHVLKISFGLLFIFTATFVSLKVLFHTKTSVDVSDVEIKLPTSANTVKIGSTQTAVITALGKPKQISKYSSQTNYKQGTVLNYNGAKFYFVQNKLANFEITSHKYIVGLASTNKYNAIGNSTTDLPRIKIEANAAMLSVKDADITTDQVLEYDINDSGKVTKIAYTDY